MLLAHYLLTRSSFQFPQWTGRRSKSGVPIFVYVVSEIRPEDLLSIGARDPDLSSVFLPAEHATNFVYPVCARLHRDGIVSSSLNIIDLSVVGVRHFWNLRRLLQKSSTMATAHYPETVDKIFVSCHSILPALARLLSVSRLEAWV